MKDVYQLVEAETRQLLADKGVDVSVIKTDSQFFRDLQMDSLDLATLIVNLEQKFGVDPFRKGFITFLTVGELAHIYQDAL